MSLPITLIKSEDEFNKLPLKIIQRLGQGSFGIVLAAEYKSKRYAIKIQETRIEDTDVKLGYPIGSDILKEALIGFELVNRLPIGIKEYFTGVTELLVCRGFACPSTITDLVEDETLKDNLNNTNEFYIIIQDFVENAEEASKWVAGKGELSEDVIRSIMFQLVLSFCYAQSILGFQHNDLKLQNIMFIENKTGKDITKKIRFNAEGDDFEYVIPAGGVQVRIIDLGSATLYGSDKEPVYVKVPNQSTPGYLPFENILVYDEVDGKGNRSNAKSVQQRSNDADLQAMFKILVNLCMHKRVKKPDNSVWQLRIVDGDAQDYTEIEWTPAEETILTTIQAKYPVLKDFTLDEFKIISMDLLLMKSLQIPMLFPKDWGLNRYGPKTIQQIKNVFELISQDVFLSLYEDINKYFNNTLDSVKGLFIDGLGLDFLRKMGSPFFSERYSFRLPAPFNEYCLANAIYHPFLSYYFWKKDITGAVGINESLKGPLILSGTKKEKAVPQKISEQYLTELEAIRAIDVSETPAPSVVVTTKTKGKKKKKKDIPPTRKSYLPWTLEKLQEDEVDINWVENIATEEELLGIPDDLINQLTDADFVAAWARKLGSTTGAKSISGARQALKKIIQARKTGLAESAIYEQLESIEHNVDFINGNDAFDTEAIEENLYLPLRDMVAENPQLAPVAAHLGIDKPLFDHATVDMSQRSNQIRFLHTLSILAEMAESKNVTDEKIERCFVEWPPQPRYKMGEVNEI